MAETLSNALVAARQAQADWNSVVLRRRLRAIARVASELAVDPDSLLALIERPNSSAAEKLASEVLPLADACRFTAQVGRRLLAPQTQSAWQAAWWMGRIGVELIREPWGVVLVLAPANYPLFIPGVQVIQALAAGNAVLVKPATGSAAIMHHFANCLQRSGIPADICQILDDSVEAGQQATQLGVDKVVLTGSVSTGQQVLGTLADAVTPATMELSGCDAVFVLPQSDLTRVAQSIAYALRLNGGCTCIAPRRVFVTPESETALQSELQTALAANEVQDFAVAAPALAQLNQLTRAAIADGAEVLFGQLPFETEAVTNETVPRMQPLVLRNVSSDSELARSDLACPVVSLISVADMSGALAADAKCPYSLGASVFGPTNYAEHWAKKINAGCVVLNDIVVPTADPRVAFGGRQWSGWGVTRGAEGLLAMTRPKTICTRKGSWLPHLNPERANDHASLVSLLRVFHSGSLRGRLAAAKSLVTRSRAQPKSATGSDPGAENSH